MSFKQKIVLNPVGYVKTSAVGDEIKDKSKVAQVVIRKDLEEGLEGLTEFSHVFVLFYLNQITPRQNGILKVHPRGRMDLPLLGVFATRTMLRPNPIGLTLVELLKVEGNIITVKGLDAYNGTPVLDVKPYDTWDMVENTKVPSWWRKLQEENNKN
jgi:tRNA-Thr(GGU) m(6)t(6)A37 methyltransferase TsaA